MKRQLATLLVLSSSPLGACQLDRACVRLTNEAGMPVETVVAMPAVFGPLGGTPSKEVYRLVLLPGETWRSRIAKDSLQNAGVPIAMGCMIIMCSKYGGEAAGPPIWSEWEVRDVPYGGETTAQVTAEGEQVILCAFDDHGVRLSVVAIGPSTDDPAVIELRRWRDSKTDEVPR
jgi:hypothetical protein